jgi:hypothetical protein
MLHKTLLALAVVGAPLFAAEPAIAQNGPPVHQGPWPIENGVKRQPTQRDLGALGDRDVSSGQAREIDRLYDELLSTYQTNHHTGIAR